MARRGADIPQQVQAADCRSPSLSHTHMISFGGDHADTPRGSPLGSGPADTCPPCPFAAAGLACACATMRFVGLPLGCVLDRAQWNLG